MKLRENYKNSPYYKGVIGSYLDINPITDISALSKNNLVSFVPMTNVAAQINQVSYDSVEYHTVDTGFTVFKRGDLIWAKITPCMQNGKSCTTNDMPTEIGFGSTEFHVIRKRNDSVYMPFIWALFSSKNVLKAAQAVFGGSAGQQRVSADFLKNFPAVLPDYDIQVSMVNQLENNLSLYKYKFREADELLAGIDKLLLERLRIGEIPVISRIASAVTLGTVKTEKTIGAEYYHPERLTVIRAIENNPAVSTRKLADIVDFLRETVSADNQSYLGLAGVVSNTGELSGAKEAAEGQAFSYRTGDVLYARLRPYLNKVLFAETDGVCSTEFHVMRVNCSDVLPEYLTAIMRSKIIVAQTKHMMTGNTHPRISNDDVRNLRIPVPSMDVQRTIISEMRNRIERSRLLKHEAETEWTAAKERFEMELMGGTSK